MPILNWKLPGRGDPNWTHVWHALKRPPLLVLQNNPSIVPVKQRKKPVKKEQYWPRKEKNRNRLNILPAANNTDRICSDHVVGGLGTTLSNEKAPEDDMEGESPLMLC
ncbi:hypothetical protein TcCL_NonESM04910 [Trypanosoma cruzi]|nr:hypothetical protein TcCL_NonESM04910 [Trypanosoma cruzi]